MNNLNYPKPSFQPEEVGYKPLNRTEDYVANDAKNLIVSPTELQETLDVLQNSIDESLEQVQQDINGVGEKIDQALNEAKNYADEKIAALVNEAPETLDTLKEVADALKDNENVVSALNDAIGSKANSADVYTKAEIDEKGYLTEHQSLDNFYTKEECDDKYLTEHQSLDEYAKVEDMAETYQPKGDYLTEHQSLDNFYTKEECDDKYLTEHQSLDEYQLKGDYVLETDVNSKVSSSEAYVLAQMGQQIEALVSRLRYVEDKMSSLKKTNVEDIVLEDGVDTYVDVDKDYVFTSNVSNRELNIDGKSVTVEDVTLSDGGKLILKGDVEIKNVTVEGEFPRTGVNKNTILAVNKSTDVVIKDTVVYPSKAYNGIEIGLKSSGNDLPKSILIDNCEFIGNFDNNIINVFGTQDNAVININNCKFGTFSNALRLSNKENVKCTINFTNCEFEDLDAVFTNGDFTYRGIVICQDYTSASVEAAISNNLFSRDKITINLINCKNKGIVIEPKDMVDICGSKDGKQLLYIYCDKGGFVNYDVNRYPKLNIV